MTMRKIKHMIPIQILIICFVLVLVQFAQINSISVKAALTGDFAKYQGFYYTNPKYPNIKLPYRIYIPKNYDSNTYYPLVVQLNGNGEDGSDNEKQINYKNVPTALLIEEENREKYPCIIVAPQCPTDDAWVRNFYGDISRTLDMTMGLIKQLYNTCNIDRNRIYITGYSTGGSGTWDLLYRFPKLFAAALPFCGLTAPEFAYRIKDVPIWVFHSSGDPSVPVEASRYMVDALKEEGSTLIKYTEFSSGDHGYAWIGACQMSSLLLPWLFSQNLNDKPDTGKIDDENLPIIEGGEIVNYSYSTSAVTHTTTKNTTNTNSGTNITDNDNHSDSSSSNVYSDTSNIDKNNSTNNMDTDGNGNLENGVNSDNTNNYEGNESVSGNSDGNSEGNGSDADTNDSSTNTTVIPVFERSNNNPLKILTIIISCLIAVILIIVLLFHKKIKFIRYLLKLKKNMSKKI